MDTATVFFLLNALVYQIDPLPEMKPGDILNYIPKNAVIIPRDSACILLQCKPADIGGSNKIN